MSFTRLKASVRLALCACAFYGLALQCARGANETVHLRSREFCPYNCAPDSPLPGYIIEIARYSFGKAGIHVDYQLMPLLRAQLLVREGANIGLVALTRTPQREKEYLFPSIPLDSTPTCFYRRPETKWQYGAPASLQQIRIGGTKGANYGPIMAEHIRFNAGTDRVRLLESADTLGDNMAQLQHKEIDALLAVRLVAKYRFFINQQQRQFVEAGCLEGKGESYIVFSRSNPLARRNAELMDAGIIELRQTGKLVGILKKYGLQDWATTADVAAQIETNHKPNP